MSERLRSPEADVLVAGAGPMAEEHVKALLAAGLEPSRILVVGRGRERAEALASRHGVRAAWAGAETLGPSAPPLAIVAVSEPALASTARALLERGARHLLVEKPGGLRRAELAELAAAAERKGASVFVGLNRRFYPSVQRAVALIAEDGGPLSLAFEFTEVEPLVLRDAERRGLPPEVLERWGLANSLHVIDLAFHLAGAPARLTAERSGTLAWHPAAAVYSGAGSTDRGALFAYVATWGGAGRWGVEVATGERKLVLRPLETLQQQRRGGFELEPVVLPGEPDGVKPGLAGQLAALLAAAGGGPVDPNLCTLADAVELHALAERILGYD